MLSLLSWRGLLIASACALAGCSAGEPSAGRARVDADVYARSGFRVGVDGGAGDWSPLSAEEGLSERAAVDLALLNNAAFQEQLADLGLARADVIQAGLITNPDALLLIPVGPKQLEATVTAPLEALWLRGPRVAVARLASERAGARLTQVALDLVRDVRVAYAEVVLARRRLALFEASSSLRKRVTGIAAARVRAGEAIPLDEATARIDELRSDQEARSLVYAVAIADERLRALMGAGTVRTRILVASAEPDAAREAWDADALVARALSDRADVLAAELAVRSATERSKLARIEWLNISFVADANERGSMGFEAGPGFRFTLPIFNQNQGAVARADAELERAVRQKRTLNDRIILEVREAHARFRQAQEDLETWRARVMPALDDAVKLAERSYRGGESPLMQFLDVNRQLLEARVREAQSAADLRRARAELERSVGRRLEPGMAATMPTTQPAGANRTERPE